MWREDGGECTEESLFQSVLCEWDEQNHPLRWTKMEQSQPFIMRLILSIYHNLNNLGSAASLCICEVGEAPPLPCAGVYESLTDMLSMAFGRFWSPPPCFFFFPPSCFLAFLDISCSMGAGLTNLMISVKPEKHKFKRIQGMSQIPLKEVDFIVSSIWTKVFIPQNAALLLLFRFYCVFNWFIWCYWLAKIKSSQ